MNATGPATFTTIHIDRPGDDRFAGLEFEDTDGEPIAFWTSEDGWVLFFEGEDDNLIIGGRKSMVDVQIRNLAWGILADMEAMA